MRGLNDRMIYDNLFSLSVFSFCHRLRALVAACHFLNCAVVIFDVSIFSSYSTFHRLMLLTYLERSLPKITNLARYTMPYRDTFASKQ